MSSMTAVVKAWKPVVGLVGALLVAAGFGFHTPAWHFQQIAAETQGLHKADSSFDARMKSIENEQTNIEKYLKSLNIAQCLDRPRRETQLMDLDCKTLLHEEAK